MHNRCVQRLIILGMGGNDAVVVVDVDVGVGVVVVGVEVDAAVVGRVEA